MRSIRVPAILALTLALAVPSLAQSTHQHGAPAAPSGDAAKAAPAGDAAKTTPAVDPAKADLLRQEFTAKTAELAGRVTAREAELETLLATRPDDTAAITKMTSEIGALRGQLLEQTTLFRLRYAKETGVPVSQTRDFGHKAGHGGGGKDGCMMMGKDKGMMGGHGGGHGSDAGHGKDGGHGKGPDKARGAAAGTAKAG